jgi:hypothetical protein
VNAAAWATVLVSSLTALGLLMDKVVSLAKARREAAMSEVEPAQVVAQAAASVAASVETLLTPLRHEIASLRLEVRALRATLDHHGIPAPQGPFHPHP